MCPALILAGPKYGRLPYEVKNYRKMSINDEILGEMCAKIVQKVPNSEEEEAWFALLNECKL